MRLGPGSSAAGPGSSGNFMWKMQISYKNTDFEGKTSGAYIGGSNLIDSLGW